MKKRLLAALMSLVMAVSMLSCLTLTGGNDAVALSVPDNSTVFCDLSWTEATLPASITLAEGTFPLTWGTNAFAAAQSAVDAAPAGGTVYLAAGTYSSQIILKKNVTLLGAKYGINPNVKGHDELTAWTLNTDRGTGETVINSSIHMGVYQTTVYADATELTVDGIQLGASGMIRSNCGNEGAAKITLKNFYIKNNTVNNPPLYFKPYYTTSAANLYRRDITIENMRVEGQSTKELMESVIADKLTVRGLYMHSDCTKGLLSNVGVSTGSTAAVDWLIEESMFCNPVYRVIYLSWDTSIGSFNSSSGAIIPAASLASRQKVTTTVSNCIFLNSHNTDKDFTLAFRANTTNTYYNFIGNTFYTSGTVSAAYAPLAGYAGDTAITDYGSRVTVKENRFIGNHPYAWSMANAGTAVDLSGNYNEDETGKVTSLPASGLTTQDWWYLDRALSTRTETASERLVDMEKDLKWLGRTYVSNNTHWFGWSNSGFELNFYGTGVTAMITSEQNSGDTNTGYLKIYVDGTHTKTVALSASPAEYVLAENLTEGNHSIKVIKRSNARSGRAGLKSLTVHEGSRVLAPNVVADRTMQFVGDSITVGYGNDNPNGDTEWSTATEDGSITYAALAGQYFGADYHTIAVSGRGIVKNIGGDTNDYAPAMYEYIDWRNKAQWTHKNFVPDVIVINYGTNDKGAGVTADEFKVGCKAFVQQVRKNNPTSQIIYAYGFMGNPFQTQVQEVVSELNTAGDKKVYFLALTPCTAAEKSIASHPTGAAHADRAQTLIAKVREVTGWTEHTTHSYTTTNVGSASCGEEGLAYKTCKTCGKRDTVTVAALPHTAGDVTIYPDSQPIGASTGLGHINCTVCGELMENNVTVPASGITVTGYTGAYDRKAHGITLSGLQADDTVTYSACGGEPTDKAPRFISTGRYTVDAYVKFAEGYGPMTLSADVAISKARLDDVAITGGYEGSYDGQKHGITVSGLPEDLHLLYSVDGGAYTETAPSYTNVTDKAHTVRVKIQTTANYYEAPEKSFTFNITPATITGITLTPAASLAENGTAQTLVSVSGNASGDTVKYSLSGGPLTTTAPTALRAGTYTVAAYITRANHKPLTLVANVTLAEGNVTVNNVFDLSIEAPSVTEGSEGSSFHWNLHIGMGSESDKLGNADLTVKSYGVYYAPSGDALEDFLLYKKYGKEEASTMLTAGTVVDKPYLDTFATEPVTRLYENNMLHFHNTNPQTARYAVFYLRYEIDGVVYEECSEIRSLSNLPGIN